MAYNLTELGNLLDALNGLNESEKYELSQAIFLETFKTRNMKELHPTMGEVHNGNKVPIIDMDGGYDSFAYVAGCQLPSCNISNNWSEFQWCIAEIGCEVTICLKDLAPKFLAFFKLYRKMNDGDIQSAFVQFIVELFQDRHLKAEFRVAYLGDTAAVTDPGTDEVPDTLFNGCNGFVTQMSALSTSDSSLRVAITENQGANLAAQTITDGQDLYDYLVAIYNKAAVKPWFDPSKMVWRLNRSLANVMVGWLNSKSDLAGINCACIDPSKVVGARGFTVENLTVLGVPVEVFEFEEAMKASPYYWDGSKFLKYKNIIILARKDVMLLGYEDDESLSQFEVGYDNRKREIYIQGSSLFGAAVSAPYFILGI